MTEAIKSVIWRKGEETIAGKKVYKYLIGTILVTDQPIDGIIDDGDHVAMSEDHTDLNMFTNAYATAPKFKPPYNLGDLSSAMLEIADMVPEDLKKLGKGVCIQCGAEGATFSEDPYAAEICDNHTPVWLCADCREQKAGDI
jgi:hypothetical protein